MCLVFFQAEDGIRDLVRSRGLGDVYKRQALIAWYSSGSKPSIVIALLNMLGSPLCRARSVPNFAAAYRCGTVSMPSTTCLLYTSDAADERSSVDLGGRRIIKKKNTRSNTASVRC